MRVKDLELRPIPGRVARKLIVENHYSHAWPAGGGRIPLGVFWSGALRGAIIYSTGANTQAHQLVEGSERRQFLELTRLWLDDRLGKNSESRVIGASIRLLKKYAPWVKWLLSYADPNVGHVGTIYQATNWLYTGLAGQDGGLEINGRIYHRRTVNSRLGTSRQSYLRDVGFEVKVVRVMRKHRYIYFLDPSWRERLKAPVLPYPKAEEPK